MLEMKESGSTYQEIAETLNEEHDTKLGFDAVRSAFRRYKDLGTTKDDFIQNLQKRRSAQKASSRNAKEVRALLDKIDNQETFLESFENLINTMEFKIHKPVKKSKKKKKAKRTLFACLSDTHYGADIDGEEMGDLNQYTTIEEARRTAFFTKEIADFKIEHRKDTDLFLALGGDLIQGVLRDLDSTTNLTSQFARGVHIVSQMISYLAQEFNSVKVISVTDNHGRAQHRPDKGRATKNRFDSYTTMMNIAIEYAINHLPNVEFEVPVTPYWYGKIQGHDFLIMHGDTTLSVGAVGKSLNIDTIKNKVNDLISGIGNIDVVVLGHLHIPVKTLLKNGTTLIVNGSLSGVDEFCLSLGIVKNNASQKLFEVTEKHAVGDMRDVDVLEADNDKKLDKIIEPFKGKY